MNKNGTVSINKVFCENLFFFNLPNVIKRCPVSERKEASRQKKYQVLVDVVDVVNAFDVVNAVDVVVVVNVVVNMV